MDSTACSEEEGATLKTKRLALSGSQEALDLPFSGSGFSDVRRNVGSRGRSDLNDQGSGRAVGSQGDLVDRLGSGGDNASDGRCNRGGFSAVLGEDFSVVRGLGGVDGRGGGVGGLTGSAVVGSDGQGLVGQQGVAAVVKEGGVVLSAAVQGLVSDVVLLVLFEVGGGPTGRSGLAGRGRGDREGCSVGDGEAESDDGRELSEHVESWWLVSVEVDGEVRRACLDCGERMEVGKVEWPFGGIQRES